MWGTSPLFLKTSRAGQTVPEYFYAQNDHLGTPQQLIDQAGEMVWVQRAEAFGKTTIVLDTVINNLRFPGQYYDRETDTHYNYFRDYEPSTGRYVQKDPIGLRGGRNLYAYVDAKPTKRFDYYGLYSSGDVLSAWNHYCLGGGTPWNTTFGSINWGGIKTAIEQRIAGIAAGVACINATIPVSFDISAQTDGADKYIIGRHMLRVSGSIVVDCDCSWRFLGAMSSALGFDPYDFDSSNRGLVGEALTWVGRNRCDDTGIPFNINISGSEELSFEGANKNGNSCNCE